MQPHSNPAVERRFILSLALTALILVAEIVGGLWTGSLALLSDSAHVFLDLFALGISFLALRISARPADDAHTYGYHRFEVLAALANGLTLAVISIAIFYEAWQRWLEPQQVKGPEMLIIAAVGLVVNIVVAFILGGHGHAHNGEEQAHQGEDLNVKSAFLHVLGDAISSLGVIAAAIIIWLSGYQWVDPAASVLIGVIILVSSGRLLRKSVHILVEGVPEGISLGKVNNAMLAVDGVDGVHDLHIWNICPGHVALSAHVTVEEMDYHNSTHIMDELKACLRDDFGISHTTIQFECGMCEQH